MHDEQFINELCWRMLVFDQGDAKRIQHFLKVHQFACLIAVQEQVDARTKRIIEAAALVHDIGIHPALAKYGRADGSLQEQEGPEPARVLLEASGMAPDEADRVVWLVAHHHTYDAIEDIDHQILVEADFLVNLYEDGVALNAVKHAYNRIFRTKAGRALCRLNFDIEENEL